MSTTNAEQLVQALDALARGELTVRLTSGDEVAGAFNALAGRLQRVTSELQRVGEHTAAGNLGQRVEVGELTGEWKKTLQSIDAMSHTTTCALRNIAQIVVQINRGGPIGRMSAECGNELGEVKEVFNEMVDRFGAAPAGAR